MTSKQAKKRVIVIGAGVAGLAAASLLHKSGRFDVTLLEAATRIGGRVHSVKFGQHYVENGAQWIHGEKLNPIFELANRFNLLDTKAEKIKFSPDSIYVTQSGEILSPDSREKASSIFDTLLDGPENFGAEESVGEWSNRIYWQANLNSKIHPQDKICHAILDWIHRFQNSIDGADNWFQTSCTGQDEYWSCEGNPTIPWIPPASYNSIFHIILNDKPNDLHSLEVALPEWILLEKEVSEIKYTTSEEGSVTVLCSDGSQNTADHIICTVSLGVLKATQGKLFQPNLSEEKQLAIKHLGFGAVNKIHFEFETQWWPQELVGFNLLWEDSDIIKDHWKTNVDEETLKRMEDDIPIWCRSLLGFYTIRSHPLTLMTWLTGPASRYMEKLDDDEVKNTCMRVLRKFLNNSYEISEPINFQRSNWYSNPHTRGSYSFRQVESELNNVWSTQLASPILSQTGAPVICFGGEATHSHYYSTVHGAYDSGAREANRITDFYTEN